MMRNAVVAIGLAIGLSCAGSGVRLWAQGGRQPAPTTSEITDRDRFKVLGHQFNVFSGDDIGVRVTGQQDANGRVPGTLVVKINGKWVDVVTPTTVPTSGR